jgi:hypothetical protein
MPPIFQARPFLSLSFPFLSPFSIREKSARDRSIRPVDAPESSSITRRFSSPPLAPRNERTCLIHCVRALAQKQKDQVKGEGEGAPVRAPGGVLAIDKVRGHSLCFFLPLSLPTAHVSPMNGNLRRATLFKSNRSRRFAAEDPRSFLPRPFPDNVIPPIPSVGDVIRAAPLKIRYLSSRPSPAPPPPPVARRGLRCDSLKSNVFR